MSMHLRPSRGMDHGPHMVPMMLHQELHHLPKHWPSQLSSESPRNMTKLRQEAKALFQQNEPETVQGGTLESDQPVRHCPPCAHGCVLKGL